MASFDYTGAHTYHVVITTKDRSRRLLDSETVTGCLIASAARYRCQIAAYCFMPDHVHLLVTGGEGTSLVRFVQHFKQATGRRYRGLWQRSFYDHILRDEESVDDVIGYIWSNPLRAGLVSDAADYPFSGPRERLLGEAGRSSSLGGQS
jgi:putative transposase